MIGFFIVGVLVVVLFGFGIFFLLMILVGLLLIWGGVVVWFYSEG